MELGINQHIYRKNLSCNLNAGGVVIDNALIEAEFDKDFIGQLEVIIGQKVTKLLLREIAQAYYINYNPKTNNKSYSKSKVLEKLNPIITNLSKDKSHIAFKAFLKTFKVPAFIGAVVSNLRHNEKWLLDNARSFFENNFVPQEKRIMSRYVDAKDEAEAIGTQAIYGFDKFAMELASALNQKTFPDKLVAKLKSFVSTFKEHVGNKLLEIPRENRNPFIANGETGFIFWLCDIWQRHVSKNNTGIKLSWKRADISNEDKIYGKDKKLYDFSSTILKYYESQNSKYVSGRTTKAITTSRFYQIFQEYKNIRDKY